MPEQTATARDRMQSAIQLAAFRYIVCLKATPTNADHRLTIDNTVYVFDAIARTDSVRLHADFQRWASTVVIRDLIESFSIFLMEVYQDSIHANPMANYSATSEQFERQGLEGQLEILRKDFSIDSEWMSRLIGFNRARNCLAHRQGIVGPRDVTDGSYLVVRWLASRAKINEMSVEPIIDIDGPTSALIQAKLTHGSSFGIVIDDREKRIAVGSVLSFHPADILEICQTFQMVTAAFSELKK
ncbi:hypothetical protein [Agrobacterium rosae]|uniref:hypothetical protein n=1 Tax=Agrobacterium rosae TaxID=1972867 RepID=UPI003A8052B9